jgi:heme A synthase
MKRKKVILYVLVILLVIAFLLRFDGVAGMVSKLTGVSVEAIQTTASQVFYGTLGGICIWVGGPLLIAGSVFLGGALVLVGIAMIGMALWDRFSTKKPDNTQIDIYKK